MSDGALMVIATTAPDRETAGRIADHLVESGLAACVQVGADLLSIYRWESRVCREAEVALVIKTTAAAYDRCAAALKRIHPYDTPQIVGWRLDRCDGDYLAWAEGAVDGP